MTEPSRSATEPKTVVAEQRRVNQVLAWVGIAASVVFIVAVLFFSGFFIGRSTDGGYHRGHWNQMPGPSMMSPGMMHPGMGPPTDQRPAPTNMPRP